MFCEKSYRNTNMKDFFLFSSQVQSPGVTKCIYLCIVLLIESIWVSITVCFWDRVLLCSPSWPWTQCPSWPWTQYWDQNHVRSQRVSCLRLPSVGVKGAHIYIFRVALTFGCIDHFHVQRRWKHEGFPNARWRIDTCTRGTVFCSC